MARRTLISKQRMWQEQHKLCYWCGRPTEFHQHIDGTPIPPNAVTVDHIYPVNHPIRRGYKQRGESSPFVIACSACNNKRGDTPFDEFKMRAAVKFHDDHARTAAVADKKNQVRVERNRNFPARLKGFGRSRKRG